MKVITSILIVHFALPLVGYSQFVENKGQVVDHNKNEINRIIHKLLLTCTIIFLKKDKKGYWFFEKIRKIIVRNAFKLC